MSVLIKGLEMPIMPKSLTQGEAVPYIDVRIFADGNAVTSKGERPYYTEYSAVPVPTPHGRLIDADVLYDKLRMCLKTITYVSSDTFTQAVDMTPTVIESEE